MQNQIHVKPPYGGACTYDIELIYTIEVIKNMIRKKGYPTDK